MEVKKIRALVVLLVMAMGMLAEQSSASFKDCYAKCFVLCMIEPSQTLCSCTTQCFKECIFSNTNTTTDEFHEETSNYDFCKLGCAFTMCSDISKKGTPNGEKVDSCVGSCSKACIKSYHWFTHPGFKSYYDLNHHLEVSLLCFLFLAENQASINSCTT